MTENVKENEVLDCPSHWDKICILRRLKKLKYSSGLVNSLKYETDDRLSSCSKFPKRPILEELERDKPDQFVLGRDFIRNFVVTIDQNNAMFRIRNPERKYVIKPVNLIMAN